MHHFDFKLKVMASVMRRKKKVNKFSLKNVLYGCNFLGFMGSLNSILMFIEAVIVRGTKTEVMEYDFSHSAFFNESYRLISKQFQFFFYSENKTLFLYWRCPFRIEP